MPLSFLDFDNLADAIAEQGYALLQDPQTLALADGLLSELNSYKEAHFQQAGIGRENLLQQNSQVRTDAIRWLDGHTSAQKQFLNGMATLRVELNRRLFMGLFDYECHFAHYRPGDFYKRHLDAFKGRTNRVLSTVLYLNPDWQPADGGELLMYEKKQEKPFLRLVPEFGKLVIFLSERFPHEVLPAQRDRYSIAGWFRVNGSIGGAIDPAR
ncbi:2OG-Fe(II) oxygenase [Aliiglaciecola sp. CAU 1673]|uniref:2OG-Fe(II) oxygenase n=1 Tax=Aliiglaciecola sp. CAU 1673 TaxID=3032595 RepID=UPI0023DBA1B7|nr:2OG-Fe(II) oxygenase [Aliiglaciecola sp. CAU 1673]MDF2179546.1 2OG-Fe(II) oxygenase [Aliiglaciecola sp. CAU 1673]